MRITPVSDRDETFSQLRQRMIEETQRFIEWGLAHPEQIHWIPSQKVSHNSRFSDRVTAVAKSR